VLVAIFVVVLRFGFLQAKFTFLRWFLPLMRLTTALIDTPGTQRRRIFLHQPSTRGSFALVHGSHALEISGLPASVIAVFWVLLLFLWFFFFFFVILLGLLSPLGETIVFEFVLMLFFSIVLVSNFNNVFTTFASFG
jgi:hypothetical protein